jgi:MoxR-like ATPase
MGVSPPEPEQSLSPEELIRLQNVASAVFVHHALVDYVVRLVVATRTPAEHGLTDVAGWVAYGASPRASLGVIAAARALALVRGRDYVLPQDVVDVVPDVLRHRLVLSYDAMADAVPVDHIISRVLQTVPLPQVSARPQIDQPTGPPAHPLSGSPPPSYGAPPHQHAAVGYPPPAHQ